MGLAGIRVQTKAPFMAAQRAGFIFRLNAVGAAGFGSDAGNDRVDVGDRKSVKLSKVVLHGCYQAVYRTQPIRSAALVTIRPYRGLRRRD